MARSPPSPAPARSPSAATDGPALAACFDTPMDVKLDSRGNIYIADTGNHRIRRIDAASGIITTVAAGHPQLPLRHRPRCQRQPLHRRLAELPSSAKSPSPAISPGGIVDGASFSAPPAPGGIFSIFGANLADRYRVLQHRPVTHHARRRQPRNQRRRRPALPRLPRTD